MNTPDISALRAHYGRLSQQFDQSLLALPAEECGEEFIYLPDIFTTNNLKVRFSPPNPGVLFYLRKSVTHSLVEAIEYFSNLGFTSVIESAYRLPSFQQQRFQQRFTEMKNKFDDKSTDELLFLANTYTAGIPILAAHIAGAAVDILLVDAQGKLLDFGCPYPHGDIDSVTDYEFLPESVKENRMILKTGMEQAGFVNYPFEYWHYSIGDVCAAHIKGEQSAIYLPVEFNPVNHTTSIFNSADSREFFPVT